MNWNRLDWLGFNWSQWILLESPIQVYQNHITKNPGLYRVRITHNRKLAYIGQTGRDLRERTRQLASKVNNNHHNPPWNDPHTAAASLWAWRIENDYSFEVSVFAIDLEKRERKCLEDMLLYQYTQESNECTLANFGRVHPNWTKPGNKKTNKRMEQVLEEDNLSWGESLSAVDEVGEPLDCDWLNLNWSEIQQLREGISFVPNEVGVYRLINSENIVYIGQGILKQRLRDHSRTYRNLNLKFSYVAMKNEKSHQLLQRESDLIGVFYKHERQSPLYQHRKR